MPLIGGSGQQGKNLLAAHLSPKRAFFTLSFGVGVHLQTLLGLFGRHRPKTESDFSALSELLPTGV